MTARWDQLPVFALPATTACLVLVLSCTLVGRRPLPPPSAAGVSSATVSGLRAVVAARLYERADVFFHRGVSEARRPAFHGEIYRGLLDAVSPTRHVHATGKDAAAIMPWLRLASRVDPHRVEFHEVAAFWLATEMGRADLAESVLRESTAANPRNYLAYLARARLALRRADRPAALRMTEAALRLWPNGETEASFAEMDRRELLTYRALLYEITGDTDRAIASLRDILALAPGRDDIRMRIDALAAGRVPALPAEKVWELMLERHGAEQHRCEREHDEHHDHEH